jgi:hypothetical protein
MNVATSTNAASVDGAVRRWRVAAVVSIVIATGYGAARGAAGCQGPARLHEDERWGAASAFVDGVQLLEDDRGVACDAAEQARRVAARLRFVVANGAPAGVVAHALPWSTPAALLGDERGLFVVYLPCRGLYRMTPAAFDRLAAGSGGAP